MASEVTLLLHRWRQGDERPLHELMPLVYGELRRIAQGVMRNQRPGQTLDPTSLVNEACLKLFDSGEPQFADRAHFLAVMARIMRQVLIDYARASAAVKRGGQEHRVTWYTAMQIGGGTSPRQLRLLELDQAMEALSEENKSLAHIIEMHYFGGMTAEEIAVVVGRSAHTVRHEVRIARAWLRSELAQ
jgi:RNA polymerase sigma factor (TIGR02999 family)